MSLAFSRRSFLKYSAVAAVAGCEMALCHTQEQIALIGGKLYHVDHNCNTPVLSDYGPWPF